MTQKTFRLRDIIILTIAANFGVRWLAVAAGIGPPSVLFWFLGALFFFAPLAIVAAQLSKLYPEAGGVYGWAKNTLSEKNSFMIAWLYCINNIFFYPAILIFLATNFSYFLGKPELAHSHTYIITTVLIAYWIVVCISIFGIKANKLLTEWGGIIGTIIPTLILIGLGLFAYFYFGHSATSFHWESFIPQKNTFQNLSNLSLLMFAMAGVEIIPTFANTVKNPKRDLFLGLLIGALGIYILYTLGTVAINFILTPNNIQNTTGLMQTFVLISHELHLLWLPRLIAFLLVFAELGALSIWLIAPIIMLFEQTPKGLIPDWLHTKNRYNAPSNAILLMGGLVTTILLLTNCLPSVANMYQVLVLISSTLYFLPYLFLAYIYFQSRNKLPTKNFWIILISLSIFLSVCLGIAFSFIPPQHMPSKILVNYESELILGPLVFILIGYLIFHVRKKHVTLN